MIEEEKGLLIGINYPITNIPNFDRQIEKEIQQIYDQFQKDYEDFDDLKEKSELNIDYQYQIIQNRYYSVVLKVFIANSSLAHPINYVKTFVFDQTEDRILTLADLIPQNQKKSFLAQLQIRLLERYKDCLLLDEIKEKITDNLDQYELFGLEKDHIVLYFNPADITASYCSIVELPIPYAKIGLENLEQKSEIVMKEEWVEEKRVLDPKDKFIALTFDDGPSQYTKELIEYLKEKNVNATFFILGNKVVPYQDTLRLSLTYGNELGNHSYNHKWLLKLGMEDYEEQIQKTQDIIHDTLGYTPVLMRPTYGDVTEEMRKHTKLDIALWNVDTLDWKYKSVNKIVAKALANPKDGNIILMHDIHKRTIEAVKKIVPKLQEMGYQLVTVSELKEVQFLRKQLDEDS